MYMLFFFDALYTFALAFNSLLLQGKTPPEFKEELLLVRSGGEGELQANVGPTQT